MPNGGNSNRRRSPSNPGTGDTGGQNPTGQPSTGQPDQGQPTTGRPTTGQPTTGNPTTGQPTTGQPITGQPTTGQPTTGQPTTGQPTQGQPTTGQPSPNPQDPGRPVRRPLPPNPAEDKARRILIKKIQEKAERLAARIVAGSTFTKKRDDSRAATDMLADLVTMLSKASLLTAEDHQSAQQKLEDLRAAAQRTQELVDGAFRNALAQVVTGRDRIAENLKKSPTAPKAARESAKLAADAVGELLSQAPLRPATAEMVKHLMSRVDDLITAVERLSMPAVSPQREAELALAFQKEDARLRESDRAQLEDQRKQAKQKEDDEAEELANMPDREGLTPEYANVGRTRQA